MSKLYNIIDSQLGEYYKEGITLEEVKETALRIMERVIDEDEPQYKKENERYLKQLKNSKTAKASAEWLSWFGYRLEKA